MPISRPRHPKPAIEKAVRYAEALGWRVVLSGGHAWGRLFCPRSSRDGCIISIWSTPRSPENHARQIRNRVDACPHGSTGEPAAGEVEA
jgi:hypothetical protein